MRLKDWFLQKSLEKARSHLRTTLAKLIPAADAGWEKTERCILAGFWPLPGVDPNVEAYQKELLGDLMTWKGPLPDKEAVELIGAEIQRAGVGAKMAVRHVVITEWSRLGKPTITQAEMEQVLGSRDDDRKRNEAVRGYALRHLALEQAVADVTGKRPKRPTPADYAAHGHPAHQAGERAMTLSKVDLHRVDPKTFITYANNESQCFCQIRLKSGERILVAGARGEIRIHRLVLFGFMPRGVVGICTAAHLSTLLPFELTYGLVEKEAMTHPLDSLSMFLATFMDIDQIRDFFHRSQGNQAAAVKHVLTTAGRPSG